MAVTALESIRSVPAHQIAEQAAEEPQRFDLASAISHFPLLLRPAPPFWRAGRET